MRTFVRVLATLFGFPPYAWQVRLLARMCPQIVQLSPADQKRCVKRVRFMLRTDQVALMANAVCVIPPLVVFWLLTVRASRTAWSMWVFELMSPLQYACCFIYFLLVCMVIGATAQAAMCLALLVIVRRRAASIVRDEVNRLSKTQVCEACGYDLRGCEPKRDLLPRCPECGEYFVQRSR